MRRPRAAQPTAAGPQIPPAAHLPKIQHSLPLFQFLCREFGAPDFDTLRDALKDIAQDTNGDGQSQFYHALQARDGIKVAPAELLAYDTNILGYIVRLNRERSIPVRLTYFQYLMLLFTERFLHRRYSAPDQLLADLNAYVTQQNAELARQGKRWWYMPFEAEHLNKLAFWSATGSGKTLLMHVNLWQWQRYRTGDANRSAVLLITPNDDLSQQHIDEFALSDITSARYNDGDQNLFSSSGTAVIVTEITKLTTTGRATARSANLDEFENFGLVLVDEGHRGASGDKWRDLRKSIAPNSLKLEYSATFGQIVNGASASRKGELWAEYHRAILFDYAYPRFYRDGYGKDYHILNIDDTHGDSSDWALLGSLLGYYEQAALYESHPAAFKPFNLQRPLWVFVGNTVTGGNAAADDVSTDIQQVAEFFRRFLHDSADWTDRIAKILAGNTDMKRSDGKDLFTECFDRIKQGNPDAADVYADIVHVVFHGSPGDELRSGLLKNAAGEIALRVGTDCPPFAVINVGEASALQKRLMEQSGIPGDDNHLSASLFASINDPDSPARVLIGSRKFMEGWNSFRVSSIGLMNLGRTEGSQIIQMFGRGVRLLGKDYSLKRTRILAVAAPPHIEILETLNVYGIRASYMSVFRDALKNEGIETDFVEVHIPAVPNDAFLQRGLPHLRTTGDFKECIAASVNPAIDFVINLRPKVEIAASRHNLDTDDRPVVPEDSGRIRDLSPLFCWPDLLRQMLDYRREKGLQAITFDEASLKAIIAGGRYQVQCPPGYLTAPAPLTLRRVAEIALLVLRKYIALLHDRRKKGWETANMTLSPLTADEPNIAFGGYTVKVEEGRTAVIQRLEALAQTTSELFRQDVANFPNLHFDRHLYQPLLTNIKRSSTSALSNLPGIVNHTRLEEADIAAISPPALEDSEVKFVDDLREYVATHAADFTDTELFLLRNQSRGTGISFFDSKAGEAFYPDFLLWLLTSTTRYLTFIDPHGIGRFEGFGYFKYRLYHDLQEKIQPKVQPAAPVLPVHLNAFILAPKPFDVLRHGCHTGGETQTLWESQHVLFQGDTQYITKLITAILSIPSSRPQDGWPQAP